jgi:type I restriction enzyme, S subunit
LYGESIEEYFEREVLPYSPDAFIDPSSLQTGYEIPFNKYFFVYKPLPSLKSIESDLICLTKTIEEKPFLPPPNAALKSKQRHTTVPWLPECPKHWTIFPLFCYCEERNEKNIGMRESNLLSLSYGSIVRRDLLADEGLLPESFETYQLVYPGDIVLRLTDLQNDHKSLRSAIVNEKGIVTSAYVVLKPKGIQPHFLNYLLRCYDLRKAFYSMGGGMRQAMNFSDLRRLPIVVPPPEEQSAIVKFVHEEFINISAAIHEKEQFIDLLQARRRALVSEAITASMKPKGSK